MICQVCGFKLLAGLPTKLMPGGHKELILLVFVVLRKEVDEDNNCLWFNFNYIISIQMCDF